MEQRRTLDKGAVGPHGGCSLVAAPWRLGAGWEEGSSGTLFIFLTLSHMNVIPIEA